MVQDSTGETDTTTTVLLNADQACKLAQISRRKLLYWQDAGLISPAAQHQFSPRNTVRLYGFDELVELLVAAQIREHLSLHHIRKVIGRLRASGRYAAPLRELRYAVANRRLYFQHPDGTWEDGMQAGQIIIEGTIRLEPIHAAIRAAARRDPALAGQTTRRRGVLGSKETFAGTRVPVQVVLEYLSSGATAAEILESFPALQPGDVELARTRLQAA
jgi:uncharacterized protein (DUF433 family)